MFGHRRSKSRASRSNVNMNVEDGSLLSQKSETKQTLKEKISHRPEASELEQRGILVRDSGTPSRKGSGKGSRKNERRKSSAFGRTKSTKMSAETIGTMTKSIIGQSVPQAAERDSQDVPRLVQQCIAFLYSGNLDEHGLFRVSGDKTQLDAVVARFDAGDANALEGAETAVVASCLKLFFRMAAAPLFTLELHDAFLGVLGKPDATQQFVSLLQKLPRPCVATVKALFPLLRAVADRNEVNMMTPANLGIVFGPTLFRSAAELAGEIDISNRSAYVVEYLITHWVAISTELGGSPASPPGAALPPPPSSALPPPPAMGTPSAAHKPPPPLSATPSASMGALPPPPASMGTPTQPRKPLAATPTARAQSVSSLPPPPANALPPPPAAAATPVVTTPVALRKGAPPPPPAATPALHVALYNFTGDATKGQINLVKGAPVRLIESIAAGWSKVESSGATGFVPSSYIGPK